MSARIGDALDQRTTELADRLGSDLRPAYERVLASHGHRVGELQREVLYHPLGHPMLQLVEGLAAGHIDDRAIVDLSESALCGYLAIRAQDDLIDEGRGDAGTTILLGTSLLARHQSLLARHVSSDAFWRLFERRWIRYAVAMAAEERLHRFDSPFGEADFDVVIERSLPLEIPPAAVLAMSDRWDRRPLLGQLVDRLVRATQLFNDFHDAPEDLAAGNHTLMVRRLGGGSRPLGREMVRISHRIVEEIDLLVDGAAELAEQLPLPDVIEWLEQRRIAVRERHEALLLSFIDETRTALEEFA